MTKQLCFEQVVKGPTRGQKTLDVLLTDLVTKKSIIAPALSPDDDNSAPSDHKIAIIQSHLPKSAHTWTKVRKQIVTEEAIKRYGEDLAQVSWQNLSNAGSVDDQVKLLHDTLNALSERWFPTNSFKVKSQEPLWFQRGEVIVEEDKKAVP